MKIAIIGSHGIGKTYFATGLYNHFLKLGRNATLISELSRLCPLPMNEKTTKKAQAWILFNQVVKEIEAERLHDIVICDRGIIDNYAYFVRAHGGDRDLDSLVRYWLPSYDRVYKIRSTPKYLVSDGFRSTDEKWQKEMDERITGVLKDFKVDYTDVDSGAWEAAAEDMLKLESKVRA